MDQGLTSLAEKNYGAYVLAGLRQRDVTQAATAAGLDHEAFLTLLECLRD